MSSEISPPLAAVIRELIQREGPISFARFMELALYHPEHGYYSSGRCAIGRRGDYFTSVSVGPLFGQMMAAQFAEVWENLDRPDEFTIVEQGAHHGHFARDVLAALQETQPALFATLRYRIVEPFSALRRQQQILLASFGEKLEWTESLEAMPMFSGIHFSNELLDAMPVHLIAARGQEWRERFVAVQDEEFVFCEQPIENNELRNHLQKLPPPPNEPYETEVNLAALAWTETIAAKLARGIVLSVDYGYSRESFYSPHRRTGTLQTRAEHRVLASPLEKVGESDLTAHVEWTSLAERAEEVGLTIAGFADQHHFLTGLLAHHPELAAAATARRRALQTLLHPEFLGTRFQFLGLAKGFAHSLGGFKFARSRP